MRYRYRAIVGVTDKDNRICLEDIYIINDGRPFRDHTWVYIRGDHPPYKSEIEFYADQYKYLFGKRGLKNIHITEVKENPA